MRRRDEGSDPRELGASRSRTLQRVEVEEPDEGERTLRAENEHAAEAPREAKLLRLTEREAAALYAMLDRAVPTEAGRRAARRYRAAKAAGRLRSF